MTSHPYPAESQTAAAFELYKFSPYPMPRPLVEAGLTVKKACADANYRLGYLEHGVAQRMSAAINRLRNLDDSEFARWFPLDPFQGGAGTAFNMNLNEAIAIQSGCDPYLHVNLHQSTNDVVPTALRLFLHQQFTALEKVLVDLQNSCQEQEQRWSGLLMTGRTQLRDAQVMSVGRVFAGWAQGIARDRWRCYKSRERIKEVNLGGTAIGSGTGAPRDYVLSVVDVLREHCPFPLTRADDMVEATSNYDAIVEVMATISAVAVNIRKISQDIRLLAAGPASGFGEMILPPLVKGSSIMAGKVNPVIPEAIIQISHKLLSNCQLITQLSAGSELQLNPFWPGISYHCWESLELATHGVASLANYIREIKMDSQRCEENVRQGRSESLSLLPLFGYEGLEGLLQLSTSKNCGLRELLESDASFEAKDIEFLFSPEQLTGMGSDSVIFTRLREKYSDAIERLSCTPAAGGVNGKNS